MGSGTDRSFQQGGARSSGLCPPSPSGLYSPPAPVPSPPFLIICPIPIPWCLGTAVSWSIPAIIFSLLSYYVPSQCSACMLFMLCMRAGGFGGVITAWFRCGFTCLITLNWQRWKEGQGCRLSYYAACVILAMNNVGEQRVEISFLACCWNSCLNAAVDIRCDTLSHSVMAPTAAMLRSVSTLQYWWSIIRL